MSDYASLIQPTKPTSMSTIMNSKILNNVIVPGYSLAGILLNEKINNTIGMLQMDCAIDHRNKGVVKINNGEIFIGYDTNEMIHSVMCSSKYNINYKNKLWPGMSVADILICTKKQIALGGCVVVDGIDGIGLPLPPHLDDFSHITDFLALDHVFEYLSIFRKMGD
jgi:hypothetical protein